MSRWSFSVWAPGGKFKLAQLKVDSKVSYLTTEWKSIKLICFVWTNAPSRLLPHLPTHLEERVLVVWIYQLILLFVCINVLLMFVVSWKKKSNKGQKKMVGIKSLIFWSVTGPCLIWLLLLSHVMYHVRIYTDIFLFVFIVQCTLDITSNFVF